jgi:hypothetical protein
MPATPQSHVVRTGGSASEAGTNMETELEIVYLNIRVMMALTAAKSILVLLASHSAAF